MTEDRYVIGPKEVEPLIDENTIGVVGVLGTTFTGEADDIAGIDALLIRIRDERGLDVGYARRRRQRWVRLAVLHPEQEWDFRLDSVRSINVSGHKFGMVYPGIGWLIFRDAEELPEDLVFYENYLGETDATFTLNFSTGSAMVLAQYYNFCRFGRDGYREIIEAMHRNASFLGDGIAATGRFEPVGGITAPAAGLLPARRSRPRLRRVRPRRSARRGARLDGPRLHVPPGAENVTVMRALVKENVGHAAAGVLLEDLEKALEVLDKKGALHPQERDRARRGPGY